MDKADQSQPRIVEIFKEGLRQSSNALIFIPLLLVSLIDVIFALLVRIPGLKFLTKFWQNIYKKIFGLFRRKNTIDKGDLLSLVFRNLKYNWSRTFVTVSGMAFGFGFVVLLVSVGYGLEELVTERIATLESKKQVSVVPAVNTQVTLNDSSINTFTNISGVIKVLPMINKAAKVTYNRSSLDVVSFGVQSDYLYNSDIQIIEGNYFDNNQLVYEVDESEVASESDIESSEESKDQTTEDEVKTISLPDKERYIIVNQNMLEVLNIKPDKLINQTIGLALSFSTNGEELSSTPIEYKVVGVIEEGNTPLVYIPIIDMKEMGFTEYSQVKVIANDQNSLVSIRRQIEVMGYTTSSIVDTLTQIENSFRIFRWLLAIIGLAALIIASLGMLNTLTVSLLERTREVGLMKVMGMKSSEVYELFQMEAMTMSMLGGGSGLLIGFLSGKLISIVLSVFSLVKGSHTIDITSLPVDFMIYILIISSLVGLVTGFYPARRATRISAINALRYE